MTRRIAVAGAGFSGAAVARCLADAGLAVTVFDPRPHVAGNCHTERDPETGVMIHRYGPHIFHTASDRVWQFVNRFGTFEPYRHRVRAITGGRAYQLPLNLRTLSAFFGCELDADQARRLLEDRSAPYRHLPGDTFEQAALRSIGPELYEAFFRGYTTKQWGRTPDLLPAGVFARLPIRFTDDDSYFGHPHQGIPTNGYTAIVESMLDHPAIRVELGAALRREECASFRHTVWTGPIDEFFGYRFGRLPYRTLEFDDVRYDGDRQGCAVVNECDLEVPITRSTEHAHFAPWERHSGTLVTSERARTHEPGDVPYYPVHLASESVAPDRYLDAAASTADVTFVGRLGTFRYLDMDGAIEQALDAADRLIGVIGQA